MGSAASAAAVTRTFLYRAHAAATACQSLVTTTEVNTPSDRHGQPRTTRAAHASARCAAKPERSTQLARRPPAFHLILNVHKTRSGQQRMDVASTAKLKS